ncbi:MAG TPA: hypothetical protein DCZ76_05725 [Treponema sp.]|nr:hypothetical protein [Treponema sp.]
MFIIQYITQSYADWEYFNINSLYYKKIKLESLFCKKKIATQKNGILLFHRIPLFFFNLSTTNSLLKVNTDEPVPKVPFKTRFGEKDALYPDENYCE